MRYFLYLVLYYLASISSCIAIYTHHQIPDQKYIQAGKQFPNVIKILILDQRGQVKASGTGTWAIDARSSKPFILTAAHVLRDGASYKVIINDRSYKIARIEYFEEFILEKYLNDYAITLVDVRQNKRLFGIRLKGEEDHKEVLRQYGLDLAAAFLTETPPLQPYSLCSVPLDFKRDTLYWAVGFGESGSGSGLWGLPSVMRLSGIRKAFNPDLKPHYNLVFTRIDNGEKRTFALLGSIFQEEIKNKLEGQVGPGDSGGPVLHQNPAGKWEICGLICSSLARIHTHTIREDNTLWVRILKKIGKLADSRTPLSYLFWQEGNVYGSEAHYIDVSSPFVREWIKSWEMP